MLFKLSKSEGSIHSEIPIKQIFESLKDGDYSGEIKKIRKQRSLAQNRYFHGVVVPMIAEYMGVVSEFGGNNKEGLEEAKEALISAFIPQKNIKNKLDKRRRVIIQKRTSDLDEKEFADFIKIILLKFPFIPPPDDQSINSLLLHFSQKYENQ